MTDDVVPPVVAAPQADSGAGEILPDSDLSSLRESIQAVEPAFAKGGAALFASVDRILRQNLPEKIDTTTSDNLAQSLSVMLPGKASSALLLIVNQCFSDSRYLTALEQVIELRPVRDWLREVVALYGHRISRAMSLSGQYRGGWNELSRFVYKDRVSEQWYIGVTLTLNDGSEISITDGPNNILLFAEALLDTLGFLPPSSGIITEQRLAGFEAAYRAFLTRFQPSTTVNEVASATVNEVR